MTVTSSQILEDSEQADGKRHITFEFTFHTAEKITRRFIAESSYNATAGLSAMVSDIGAQMIEQEDEQILADIENGADSTTVVPVHPETDSDAVRQKRFFRKLCRWAMENRDIKWVRLAMYPVWYLFKFTLTYTPAQIQNILDLTVPQYNKFNDRLTAFHNSIDMIDDDDDYVGEL